MRIEFKALFMAGLISFCGCSTTYKSMQVDHKAETMMVVANPDQTSLALPVLGQESVSKAIELLKTKLTKRRTDIPILQGIAQLHLIQSQADQAYPYVMRAIRYDVKNKKSRKILAQLEISRGHHSLAAMILNAIGGVDSKDAEVLNLLAQVELSTGDPQRAQMLFRKAIEVDGSHIAARQNLAVLFIRYKQMDMAGVELERILKIAPSHPDANFHMAIVKTSRGEFPEAEHHLRSFLAYQKNHPLALFNLAMLQHRSKNYDAAVESLNEYLATERGRSGDADGLLALIQQIKQESQESQRQLSDAEINRLVAESSADLKVANKSDIEELGSGDSESDDEISKLERALAR